MDGSRLPASGCSDAERGSDRRGAAGPDRSGTGHAAARSEGRRPPGRSGAGSGPDPLGARSALATALFAAYLRWYLARHFHALRMSRTGVPALPPGRPVIVFANHPSWWDPTLFILAHRALLPGRIGYGPMEAAALARYGVLRRVGVFGVAPGRAGAAGFLRTALRVLAEPRAALWITAEGRFADPRARPVLLRPGIAHLARRVEGAVLLPLAVEYAFWNESRPEALLRFGRPIEAGAGRSVAEWTRLLEAELSATMDGLAAESISRDPARFHTLLQGGTGVGGVYDLWRRARALLSGRRFDAAHEADPTPVAQLPAFAPAGLAPAPRMPIAGLASTPGLATRNTLAAAPPPLAAASPATAMATASPAAAPAAPAAPVAPVMPMAAMPAAALPQADPA